MVRVVTLHVANYSDGKWGRTRDILRLPYACRKAAIILQLLSRRRHLAKPSFSGPQIAQRFRLQSQRDSIATLAYIPTNTLKLPPKDHRKNRNDSVSIKVFAL